MNFDHEIIEQRVVQQVKKIFPANRIYCLLRYGPVYINKGKGPKDLDFLLLLDSYNPHDYGKLFNIKKAKLPIEIFIEYKDYLKKRGLKNYQRGCHGVYFLLILASAKLLIGKNFYTQNIDSVSTYKAKKDLFFRIEEYFYRIQKEIINRETDIEQIKKNIGRIVTDLMLLNNEINFSEMHTLHVSDILKNKLNKTKFLKPEQVIMISNFIQNKEIDLIKIGKILDFLLKKYLNMFVNFNKENENKS